MIPDFGTEGRVCICASRKDESGIMCSDDYGSTFGGIMNVSICRLMAFGRSQSSMNKSVMYYYGLSDKDASNGMNEGVYVIDDSTNQHIRMNTDKYSLGDGPNVMAADRQTFGIVYVGSNGRGIYYSRYVES